MKSFGLENVKAFKDSGFVDIAPITIFVGQNSCGKSSFIRFFKVLNQSLNPTIHDASRLALHSHDTGAIDYGNFSDVVYGHTSDEFTVKWTYDYDMSNKGFDTNAHTVIMNNPEFAGIVLPIMVRASFKKTEEVGSADLYSIEIYIDDKMAFKMNLTFSKCQTELTFGYVYSDDIRGFKKIDICCFVDKILRMSPILPALTDHDCRIICWESVCKRLLGLKDDQVHFYAKASSDSLKFNIYEWESDEQVPANIMNDLEKKLTGAKIQEMRDFVDAYELMAKICAYTDSDLFDVIGNLSYIGPFRVNPERIYRGESNVYQIGVHGENTSSLLINSKIRNTNLLRNVSDWFNEAFGYQVEVAELGDSGYYQLIMKKNDEDSGSNLMDVGYGISQVLPIATMILDIPSFDKAFQEFNGQTAPGTFVIEQPELHLHPAAQAKLADLFVRAIAGGAHETRRLLIETHSEHLISALQIMIADPRCFLTKDMVKIYYVDRNADGDSIAKEMAINEEGQFSEDWPKGFFDKSYTLSKELLKAIFMRRRSLKGGKTE